MDNYFHIHMKENNNCLQGRTLPSEFKEASAADTPRERGRVWKDEGRSKEDRILLGLSATVRVWAILLGEMGSHWSTGAEDGLCARYVESTLLQSGKERLLLLLQ